MKVYHPSVAKGVVVEVSDDKIVFQGTYGQLGIIHKFDWTEKFKVGDDIYYAYALSKEDFSVQIP